jgi:HTH-type transcriptional regulator, sugar sensing transcriptional regulator
VTLVIDKLQNLGFSQYEAQAYIALLKEHPANGYELARASGIPRPNIYPVLQKLEERGAVLRVDSSSGSRYAPVEPDELVAKLKLRYQNDLDAVSSSLHEVPACKSQEQIYNLRGYDALLEEARIRLANTNQRLLISIWPEEAILLADAVHEAQERGVKIVTLCLRGCPQPCPACRGEVFRYPVASSSRGRWLVLVSDGHDLLAGEISSAGDALAVRTFQPMLVNLSAGYIQNSIALASLLEELGERLEKQLNSATNRALNALIQYQDNLNGDNPAGSDGEWLEGMRHMLGITRKDIQENS